MNVRACNVISVTYKICNSR